MKKARNNNGARGINLRVAPVLLFAICCSLVASLHAAKIYPSEGSAAAAFLKIGVGARAVGMGGAYTAVSDDPYAMYWNPAGLALLTGRNLAFTHNDYFAGFTQEYAAYTAPAPHIGLLPSGSVKNGVVGASFNYFYYGNDLERRSGNYEGLNDLSPVEGKFGANDMAFSLGYGGSLGGALKAGAEVKLIQQSIDTRSAASAALDLGALYDFDWQGRAFTAGLAVRNLGPGIKFIDRRYPLPMTASAGLSTRLYKKSLLLSLDLSKPIDNYPSLALGLEQKLAGRLFLRAGYRYRQHGNETGGLSGFAFGLGFAAGTFTFDYALSPFGDLGNTQRLSAALRFSGPGAKGTKMADAASLSSSRELELRVERKSLALSRSGITSLVRVEVVEAGLGAEEPPAAPGLPSVPALVLSSSPVQAAIPAPPAAAAVVLSSPAAAVPAVEVSSAPAVSLSSTPVQSSVPEQSSGPVVVLLSSASAVPPEVEPATGAVAGLSQAPAQAQPAVPAASAVQGIAVSSAAAPVAPAAELPSAPPPAAAVPPEDVFEGAKLRSLSLTMGPTPEVVPDSNATHSPDGDIARQSPPSVPGRAVPSS